MVSEKIARGGDIFEFWQVRAAFAKLELEGVDFLELASLAAIIFSDTQASKRRGTDGDKYLWHPAWWRSKFSLDAAES